jgi:hypothetical protein
VCLSLPASSAALTGCGVQGGDLAAAGSEDELHTRLGVRFVLAGTSTRLARLPIPVLVTSSWRSMKI